MFNFINIIFNTGFALMASYFSLLVQRKVTKRNDTPSHFALRVPIVCTVDEAAVKLANNAQTVTAESPLPTAQTMAPAKGELKSRHQHLQQRVLITAICILTSYFSSVAHAVTNIEVQALLGKKVVVLIDGTRRTLSVDKTSPEGVKLLSVNRDGAKLEVDGKVKDYLLGSSISMHYAEPESLEEKVFANESGMFLRTGSINGYPVKFLVDTGATSIAMNTTQAKRLGIRYRIDGKVLSVSTASSFAKAYQVKLKTVSLGSIKLKNISAVVIDGKHPGPILLGMTFLSKLKVSTVGDTMTLKKRK